MIGGNFSCVHYEKISLLELSATKLSYNSIAVHVQTTDHIIKWENAEVLQREQHRTRRKIKEAMYIQTSRCMNLDQGMSVDPIWNDIIPSINTNN